MGDVIYPPGGQLGPRIQKNLQLVYVWSGSATVRINGKKTDVGSGESVLLLPHRREDFAFAEQTSTHHGWCEAVHPIIDPKFERQLQAVEGAVRETPAQIRELAASALQLKEDHRWGAQQAFSDLCSAILYVYAASAGLQDPQTVDATPRQMPPALVRAIEWVHADPAGVTSMARVAERVGVSQQHLGRLFFHHCGVTPATYLWNVRTEKAIELIRSTGLSLSEVASQCGFKTQFHLSRRVRERTGTPPSELQ